MRKTPPPLLCELHAHSTWSDGDLSLRELVDLYGESGFDVLCVTDHVGRTGWEDPRWRVRDPASFADYLAAIKRETERALLGYGLLVVPGLELTYDDEDPLRAAHAVAISLRTFVGMDGGLEPALTAARSAGAAIIAAHPYTPTASGESPGPPPAGPPRDTHSPISSIATSSSTGGTSSHGSPRPASAESPPATSTAWSTYGLGRRSSPARAPSARSWSTCAQTAPPTSSTLRSLLASKLPPSFTPAFATKAGSISFPPTLRPIAVIAGVGALAAGAVVRSRDARRRRGPAAQPRRRADRARLRRASARSRIVGLRVALRSPLGRRRDPLRNSVRVLRPRIPRECRPARAPRGRYPGRALRASRRAQPPRAAERLRLPGGRRLARRRVPPAVLGGSGRRAVARLAPARASRGGRPTRVPPPARGPRPGPGRVRVGDGVGARDGSRAERLCSTRSTSPTRSDRPSSG